MVRFFFFFVCILTGNIYWFNESLHDNQQRLKKKRHKAESGTSSPTMPHLIFHWSENLFLPDDSISQIFHQANIMDPRLLCITISMKYSPTKLCFLYSEVWRIFLFCWCCCYYHHHHHYYHHVVIIIVTIISTSLWKTLFTGLYCSQARFTENSFCGRFFLMRNVIYHFSLLTSGEDRW